MHAHTQGREDRLWQTGKLRSWWAGEWLGKSTVGKEEGDRKMWQRPAGKEGGTEGRGDGVGSWQGVFLVLCHFWREALVGLDA